MLIKKYGIFLHFRLENCSTGLLNMARHKKINDTMAEPRPRDAQQVSFEAAAKILRPLVKFLITRGITYPAAIEMLKTVFVEIAATQFALSGKRNTDSRISMLTGVHRAEVKRLSTAAHKKLPEKSTAVSLGAQVVARWMSDPAYTDRHGNPLPLPRLAGKNAKMSFEALVASVRTDIRARPVLDEWLDQKVVELDAKDRVHLKVQAFVPKKGFGEKVYFFAKNVHDHIMTGVNNVLEEGAPMLDTSVYYHRLSPASVETLHKLAVEAGMRAVHEVNRLGAELDRLDGAHGGADRRMNFGVYFYAGPSEPDAIPAPPARRAEKG
jgi:Family of unknown function (DUF6502)